MAFEEGDCPCDEGQQGKANAEIEAQTAVAFEARVGEHQHGFGREPKVQEHRRQGKKGQHPMGEEANQTFLQKGCRLGRVRVHGDGFP